jgi:hypothetical protein
MTSKLKVLAYACIGLSLTTVLTKEISAAGSLLEVTGRGFVREGGNCLNVDAIMVF